MSAGRPLNDVIASVVTVTGLAAMWLGVALGLTGTAWARRRPLRRRLGPHLHRSSRPAAVAPVDHRSGVRRWGSVAAVLSPPVLAVLDRCSRAFGADDDLRVRLWRSGDERDPISFRAHQLAGCAVAACVGGAAAVATRSTPALAVTLGLGVPVGWLVGSERALEERVTRQQRRVQLELPVVAEQLGILIGAGFSLPAAMQRLGERGHGRTAEELAVVCRSLRQGVAESAALAAWERRAGVDAVSRLVRVLAMHRDATDLGRLVTAEARATRAESHRLLVETIERRSQLVWIPVTVATLVPGLLLLAIPFVAALRQVSG